MSDAVDGRQKVGAPFAKTRVLAGAALICSFIGVVAWFGGVDFYHRHFFDTGPIVAADNLVRVVFVVIFSWLIYVPGAAAAALLMSADERAALTPPERAVFGFGIGVGIWHVVMLILGLLGLYDRPVIVGLCLAVVVVSARHFANVAVAGWRSFALGFAGLRQGHATPERIGIILIGIAAVWLLLLRGLFPGGGGDYYTHYFYYYLEVLKNHGLAPNDVWYHYYYSKGSGLAFLGMLLTDPEAPALTTYPCVVFAAVAIATLAARMAPNSLWPAAGAVIYLFYYLVSFSADGGGQFQKDHEEVAALVALTAWALCMERRAAAPRPFRIMAAATAIAAALVTPPIAVLLGFFVGLLAAWSMLRRRWSDLLGYSVVVAAIASAVLAVFVVSYLQTGLASDQALDLTLRFADPARLDRWGVIPQIIAVAWIRDNYLQWEQPFGRATLQEIADFLRLRFLWPFLSGPLIAVVVLRMSGALTGWRLTAPRDARSAALSKQTVCRLVALVLLFAIVALVAGRAQSLSFARLSSFFVPVLVMLAMDGSVWALNWPLARRDDAILRLIVPALLLVGTLVAWQSHAHWTSPLRRETANAVRFLAGSYSLAQAYSHANSPYPFGAINPGALAAAQQLPYGTPIWSTNVDSYCMVPGCLIESVISFKMSGRLDEILGGDPELAKLRLQQAGLNYFLFMTDYRMIDLLPFSSLFAPETIGSFLGVKWSDGSTYLLTWIGPDTTPIGPDFLEAYRRRLAEPEVVRWFRFDELAPLMATIAPRMRAETHWGALEKLLTWRHSP
jgi:hypothetical protein